MSSRIARRCAVRMAVPAEAARLVLVQAALRVDRNASPVVDRVSVDIEVVDVGSHHILLPEPPIPFPRPYRPHVPLCRWLPRRIRCSRWFRWLWWPSPRSGQSGRRPGQVLVRIGVGSVSSADSCSRCNGENHLARDCLAPKDESAAAAAKKCYKCQELGHIAR